MFIHSGKNWMNDHRSERRKERKKEENMYQEPYYMIIGPLVSVWNHNYTNCPISWGLNAPPLTSTNPTTSDPIRNTWYLHIRRVGWLRILKYPELYSNRGGLFLLMMLILMLLGVVLMSRGQRRLHSWFFEGKPYFSHTQRVPSQWWRFL